MLWMTQQQTHQPQDNVRNVIVICSIIATAQMHGNENNINTSA